MTYDAGYLIGRVTAVQLHYLLGPDYVLDPMTGNPYGVSLDTDSTQYVMTDCKGFLAIYALCGIYQLRAPYLPWMVLTRASSNDRLHHETHHHK